MTRPKIAIAGFQHETNTFAPMPTPFEEFERGGAWPGLTKGQDMIDVFAPLNIPIGGFIRAAEGIDLVPILWAAAEPAGYVEQAGYDRIAGMIVEGIAGMRGLDGVYLDLHGAMVTDDHEDGEGELVRRIREAVGRDLPIAVSLDLHGNMTPDFAALASSVAIYRTYPHIDMAETGARTAALLAEELTRGEPFAKAYRQVGFIPPINEQSTMREPGGRLYGMLPGIKKDGVRSIDFAFGFPPADIWHCGPSIFAYGDDQMAVDAAADRMLAAVDNAEAEFDNPLIPAAEAVRRAIEASARSDRPVVICDPQDNPGAGAVGDSTGLLAAMVAAAAPAACIGMIWDPETVAQAHAAGEGATVEVRIGGLYPEVSGAPVPTSAEVERVTDGRFTFTGPMYGGAHADLGPMSCLRIRRGGGDIRVVLGTVRCQNADQEIFRTVGVEPARQRIVGVKSAVHFLADYQPIASEVIFAEAPGANPCALDRIPYRRLRPGVRLGARGPAHSPAARTA